MLGLAAGVGQAMFIQPGGESSRQVGWSVIAKQPWTLLHSGGIETGGVARQVRGLSDVGSCYRRTGSPSRDVAREVIEHGRQIEPAPADDQQVGEISLPQLVYPCGRVTEVVGGLEQNEGRAGDEASRLQQSLDRNFGNEIVLPIDKRRGQFARRRLGRLERQVNHCRRDLLE